jgi:uncharacterized membrane protein
MAKPQRAMGNLGAQDAGVSRAVDRDMRALLKSRERKRKEQSLQDRIADAIGRFAGSMPFVYIHVALFGFWIVVNLGLTPIKPFDPAFTVLAMIASVEAIFLTTFVLITQNRMAALADDRADLDLELSLLTERELTRLLELTAAMARKLEIKDARTPELEELLEDVRPEELLDTLRRNKP